MFQLRQVKKQGVLDIDELHIPAQTITCIVGESGSGKTTLLRMLNGMDGYDEGEIWVNGKPLSELDLITLRRQVVMLPQTPAIFTGNIRDNLLIGLRFSQKPLVSDEVLRDALGIVRLHKELDQDTEVLSGGEKQRLALARAILLQPQALLLDEPTSALDDQTSMEVMSQLMQQFKQQGQTIVMVTHSAKLARTFAEYMIEISKGCLVRAGGVSVEFNH